MNENLVNMDDLMVAMEQLKDAKTGVVIEDSEEMKASQRRYEEYIKKNME